MFDLVTRSQTQTTVQKKTKTKEALVPPIPTPIHFTSLQFSAHFISVQWCSFHSITLFMTMFSKLALFRSARFIARSGVHRQQQICWLGTKAPGSDPLVLIREECHARNLCDEYGYRRPGVHWVFSVAVTPDDPNQPPNLRTVGVQRVSSDGIDFVMKKGSGTCDALAAGRPIAVLHLQGRYMPGEMAEQWRGEGHCERLPLIDLKELLPHYTITSMVSSKRIEHEKGELVTELSETISGDRLMMENKSHTTEIMQKTRLELENGDVSDAEIDDAIRAFRFHPIRLECMVGGPDSVLWSRWEWSKRVDNSWQDASPLLPH